MSNVGFGTAGRAFIEAFFRSVDDSKLQTAAYFEETFVAPPDFSDLVESISPTLPARFVVIDGQSRVGKTWSVVGAIATLLDREKISSYWTAGEDSYRAFDVSRNNHLRAPGFSPSVIEALLQVRDDIGAFRPAIIFLDDFLGTVRLRRLAHKKGGLHEIARFLDWDQPGNLLRALLPETGGCVVLTNRATLLTAAEVKLGFQIRKERGGSPCSMRIPRGFFRSRDGRLAGAFTETSLRLILARNRIVRKKYPEYHLPHVTAFLEKPPKSLVNNPKTADALFGADLNELALEVLDLESRLTAATRLGTESDVTSLVEQREKCDSAYLMAIAPGLIFLGASAYRVLHLHAQALSLIKDLYLRIQDVSVRPGRVPNEFYVLALKRHLAKPLHLTLAVRVWSRVSKALATEREFDPQHANEVKVGVRGLIERALAAAEQQNLPVRRFIPEELNKLAQEYDDPLFHWELDNDGNSTRTFVAKPGFTAALGWALFQFPELRSKCGKRAVDYLAEHLRSDVASLQNLTPSRADVDLMVSRYSTFLQWAIRLELEHPESTILGSWTSVIPVESSDWARELNVVLEDEIVWADTLKDSSIQKLEAAQLLRKRLDSDDPAAQEWDKSSGANLLFSLAWHNEWMEHGESFLGPAIRGWIERCSAPCRLAIQQEPDILDFNLQYHWLHFITQHGAWMRSWCFSDNPDKYERDRVAQGSRQEIHNILLFEIISELFKSFERSGAPAERFRNGLMLLGTRTSRLGDQKLLLELLESPVHSRYGRQEFVRAGWEAIFELTRQGYLDAGSPDTSPEFRSWCVTFRSEHASNRESAWTSYLAELNRVSHLDLLPYSWDDMEALVMK